MIHILVVTDKKEEWINKFLNCIKINFCRSTSQCSCLRNDMFQIDITTCVNSSARGCRYSTIILDKRINDVVEREILLPKLTWNVIKTDNYYKELVEECKNRK